MLPLAVAAAILQGCGGGAAGGSNGDLVAENMLVDSGVNVATAAGTTVSLSGTAYNETRTITSMNWVIKQGANDPQMDIALTGGSCNFGSQSTPDDSTVTPASTTVQAAGTGKWTDVKTCAASLNVGAVPTAQQIVMMLTALDSDGHSRSDEVTVSVAPNMTALVVDAGPDVNAGAEMSITTPCSYTGGFWYDRSNKQPSFRWYIKNAADLQLNGVNLGLTWDAATGSMTLTTPTNLTADIDAQLACEVTDEAGIVAEDVAMFHLQALDPLVASAGAMQVVQPNVAVTLDASGTTDPTGSNLPIYYQWSQISGTSVILQDANTAKPSFLSPNVPTTEDLVFQVSVSREPIDATTTFASSEQAETVVKVMGEDEVGALIVSAGDAQVVKPSSSVTITATVEDPSGGTGPYYYLWEQTSGPLVTLSNANSATASFVAPGTETDLAFRVSVSRDPIDATTEFATTEQSITTVGVRLSQI